MPKKPRKKSPPLSADERAICARIRQLREMLGLTQDGFAQNVGLLRESYTNYEYERSPVPYEVALKICRQLIVSERWLAKGEGPVHQYLGFKLDPVAHLIVPNQRFSEVYDRFLESLVRQKLAQVDTSRPFLFSSSELQNPVMAENFLNLLVRQWKADVPTDLFPEFVQWIRHKAEVKVGELRKRDLDKRLASN